MLKYGLQLSGRLVGALLLAAGLAVVATPVTAQAVRPEVVAAGLVNPWAVAFLPDGRFLVTERPGRLRLIGADGKLGPALTGLPEVVAAGQGGLLDLILDSSFAQNRVLYLINSTNGTLRYAQWFNAPRKLALTTRLTY